MSDKQSTTPDPANKGTQQDTRKRLEQLGLPDDKTAQPPGSPQADAPEQSDEPSIATQQTGGAVLKDVNTPPAKRDNDKKPA
jgi:hypothetical protein